MASQTANSRTKLKSIPSWLVAGVDISLVNLSFYLAFILVEGMLQVFYILPFAAMIPWLSAATVLFFSSLGLYSSQRTGFTTIVRSLIAGVIGISLVSVAVIFFTGRAVFNERILLVAPPLTLVLLLGWRILNWRLDLWIHGQKKVLVIGYNQEVEQALDKIMCLPQGIFEVVKVLAPEKMGHLPEWLDRVDSVMITGSLDMELKNRVIRQCFDRGNEVFIVPDLYEILLARARMTQVHDTPVIECRHMEMSFIHSLAKRLLDLVFAVIMAVPAVPLLLLAGLAVWLTSPGPVIYTQERVGLKGKTFVLYKLRTMVHNAEEKSGPVLATENDDRVTPVGRFLRATRLDELPQLWNVLQGDLSIVGPRPERPYFVRLYEQSIPEYNLRHLVKPGITGLAQVNGHYSTDTRDKLRYDLYYVADYSLWLDLKILLMTIPTLFNMEASQGVKGSRVSEASGSEQNVNT